MNLRKRFLPEQLCTFIQLLNTRAIQDKNYSFVQKQLLTSSATAFRFLF